jgi:hypothetical protein
MGAKMKTFFTHCFGRREIRKYFSVAIGILYQKGPFLRNQ